MSEEVLDDYFKTKEDRRFCYDWAALKWIVPLIETWN
jgi:hypothetical protein